MAKRYARLNWQNKPSVATPINATNLNKMDKGIDDIDTALNNLENSIVGQIVNDPTKINNAAVNYSLKQSIDAINNNLGSVPFTATITLTKSTDFNTITTPGVYFYNSWAGDAGVGKNQPETSGLLGFMLVFGFGGSRGQVLFTPGKYMIRHYDGTAWYAWKSLVLT